jgi:hypothetical protein
MVRVGGPGYGWSILPMTGVRIATARDGHALHGHTLLTWADADLVRCPLDQALVQSSGALIVDVVLRAKANTTTAASSPRSVNWNARGSTEVRGEQEERVATRVGPLALCVSVSLWLCGSVVLSVSLSLCLSVSLSLCLSVSLFVLF